MTKENMESEERITKKDRKEVEIIQSLTGLMEVIDEMGKFVDLNMEVGLDENGKKKFYKAYDALKSLVEELGPFLKNDHNPDIDLSARQLFVRAKLYLADHEIRNGIQQ